MEIVDILLENGADWHALDRCQMNPFMTSIYYGNLSIASKFLELYQSDEHRGTWKISLCNDTGHNALHLLARTRKPLEDEAYLFSSLLDASIEQSKKENVLYAQNYFGESVLHIASLRGRSDLVRRFLQEQVPSDLINDFGEMAIHYAARSGDAEALCLLFEDHPRSLACTGDFGSVRDIAARHAHSKVLEYLERHAPYDASEASTMAQAATQGVKLSSSYQNVFSAASRYGHSELNDTYWALYRDTTLHNGSTRLAPRMRRMHHLRRLVGRNFVRLVLRRPEEGTPLLDTCFTLHRLGRGMNVEETPFYQSQVVEDTVNPNWHPMSLKEQALQDVCTFVVRVWDCTLRDTLPYPNVLEFTVNLRRLRFLGRTLDGIRFPPLTLLIELQDGFYAREDLFSALRYSKKRPPVQEDKGYREARSHTISSMVALIHGHKKRIQAEASMLRIKEAYEAAFEARTEDQMRLQSLNLLKQRVRMLRTRRDATRLSAKQAKETGTNKWQFCVDACTILREAHVHLMASREELVERGPFLKAQQTHFCTLSNLERMVQRSLLSHAIDVFQIQRIVSEKEDIVCSILGIIVPNDDFAGMDEERIAAAMGYMSLLIRLISRWLNIPLHFHILYHGSHSLVGEHHTREESYVYFPLYLRGSERNRWTYACILLNKSIQYLLSTQRLSVHSIRHTLPNLLRLLQSASRQVSE